MIGIEDGWTKKVVDGIASTGKPVVGFGIEGHGDHDTILRASMVAREYVQWASKKQREACAVSELWVSANEASDKLLECLLRTANGRFTAAEALGHREFVLTRLYESA